MKHLLFNVQSTRCNVHFRLRGAMMFIVLFFVVRANAQEVVDTVPMNDYYLQNVEIFAKRIQQTTLSHEVTENEKLNNENIGQNLPYLLSTTPGIQITSDDGLGVGYTYFRIRGTDHTRINMTVNDVPLNDSESQTVFWVNMTDMAYSISSIDVQRGVGTSTNGPASFGASLNMQTGDRDTVNRFSLAFNGGMYNTFREMVNAHVSLPGGKWMLNARFSKVNSDGFLYRTKSDLYSYYGDFGWYGKRTQVIARVFGGSEKTGMGWVGVDYNTAYGIDGADRRYNPAGKYTVPDSQGNDSTVYYPNQTDNYSQQHTQLTVNHRLTPEWSLSTTLHYTHGRGYYEQYKKRTYSDWGLDDTFVADPEAESYGLYMKWLGNHFFGAVASAKYVSDNLSAQLGVAANDYMGKHWGVLDYLATPGNSPLPVHYEYYRNNANKIDANGFAKVDWSVINKSQEKLNLYADLQYRFIRYKIDGINDEDMSELPIKKDFHFFNPKAGLTYQNQGHLLYGSFAMANREPSRKNYTENLHYDKLTDSYSGVMPKAETLYDYEIGYQYSHKRFSVGLNFYFMDYDNQLVLTGRMSDVGAYLTTNVKDSYRMGVEISAGVKILSWFRWDANCVLSRNKILNYTETITRYNADWERVGEEEVFFKQTTIAFSPSVTAMNLFTFDYGGFVGKIQTNVIGKQYLDNTQNKTAMLKAYTTTNVNLQYSLPMKKMCENRKGVPEIKLLCQLNNIFNAKYANNGGSDCSYFEDGKACWPWYYAQAGFNVHAGFTVCW